MNDKFLVVGVLSGCLLWGSLTSLLETSGVVPIVGLIVSVGVLGFAVGLTVIKDHK